MDIEFVLDNLVYFAITFIFVFLIDYLFLCKDKKKKYKITSEGIYLIKKFSLDKKKIDIKRMDFQISIINAVIIAFVTVTIYLIKSNIIIKFGVGFVLLFLLIYSVYEIYGRHLARKYGVNDGI